MIEEGMCLNKTTRISPMTRATPQNEDVRNKLRWMKKNTIRRYLTNKLFTNKEQNKEPEKCKVN